MTEHSNEALAGERPPPPVDALHPHVATPSTIPVIVRGEGVWVYDQYGKRYLDGLSGLFTSQVGHGRTELAEAAARQASTLAYFPVWSYAHPMAVELADRLAELTPGDCNRIFFTTGGSEAVESAWKLARQYFRVTGQPDRQQGDQPEHRLPRGHHGRAVHHRAVRDQDALRAPGARGDQGAQHQLLPGPVLRRRPRGLRPVGRRRHRAGHPHRGPRDGGRRLPRAGAERRRLLPAAARLLPAGAGDLRPLRRAPGVRRGDLRLRSTGPLVRGRALRLPARHRHHGQGADQWLLPARSHGGERPAGGAVPPRARASSTASPSAATR